MTFETLGGSAILKVELVMVVEVCPVIHIFMVAGTENLAYGVGVAFSFIKRANPSKVKLA